MIHKTDWIQTFTGRKIYPLEPHGDDIDIDDIAQALSMKCRFTGHVNRFLSIAQHSVLVSRECPPHLALTGLLHDAGEAYLPDVSRPVKPFLYVATNGDNIQTFKMIEDQLLEIIMLKYGGCFPLPGVVHEVDDRMNFTEGTQLMPDHTCWKLQRTPFDIKIQSWDPWYARKVFMDEFKTLTGR